MLRYVLALGLTCASQAAMAATCADLEAAVMADSRNNSQSVEKYVYKNRKPPCGQIAKDIEIEDRVLAMRALGPSCDVKDGYFSFIQNQESLNRSIYRDKCTGKR